MKKDNYSVLMSVYYKENPDYLRKSMESIFKQTVPTDDFVLVCDGPLGKNLDSVIEDMKEKFGSVLNVVRIPKNVGLGNALNVGIKYCKNDLVARMDSDDISRCRRCEKQLEIFRTNSDIAIVSGTVEEFSSTPEVVEAQRCLPESNADILAFAKKRNPFNHPCVMYRKSKVEAAGGYQDFYLLEDYYLWIRMLMKNHQGYNLQEPLLWMRAGNDMYKRRSGMKYAKSQKKLLRYMYDNQFISRWNYFVYTFVRCNSALMPNVVRKALYCTFLRK